MRVRRRPGDDLVLQHQGVADLQEKGPVGPGDVHALKARGIIGIAQEQDGLLKRGRAAADPLVREDGWLEARTCRLSWILRSRSFGLAAAPVPANL